MKTTTLETSPPPAPADSLALREGDSLARRIFITYTTHIPWMVGRTKAMTKEDERCYIPHRKAND